MRFFNFFKRKIKPIEPYVEKYTECDKCEYLSECKSKGNYIDCTTVDDKRRHFLCSKENCRKMGV